MLCTILISQLLYQGRKDPSSWETVLYGIILIAKRLKAKNRIRSLLQIV